MKSNHIEVDYRYTRKELETIFAWARSRDVEKGGRYDAPSAAINVWTHSWTTKALEAESTVMGSIYVHWGEENRVWRIDADKRFCVEDMMKELGTIKEKALGKKKYGV